MINVSITFSLKSGKQSVWENGIIQNVIFFSRLLKNIGKYNVILANTNEAIKTFDELQWKTDDIQIKNLSEVIDDTQLLIMMGAQISAETADKVKSKGGKVIAYYCGNHFIMEMENVLFKKKEKSSLTFGTFFDDIWMIPQIFDTNQHYLGLMHRKETRCIPFVWDSYLIDQLKPTLKNNGEYRPSNEPKTITTFEPNINVVKYAMYPILIYEDFYTKSELKDKIKHMLVTNGSGLIKDPEFTCIMNHFSITKDKKIFFESRYRTPDFLSMYGDIVIEHQWENALNYLYLDVAYLGYPLIHNAHMVSDLGYYYNAWDVKTASGLLEKVLREHDDNQEEYNTKNRLVLDRYRPTAELSLITYDKLIKNILK